MWLKFTKLIKTKRSSYIASQNDSGLIQNLLMYLLCYVFVHKLDLPAVI